MADSSVTFRDATGATVTHDTRLNGGEHRPVLTIGDDGTNLTTLTPSGTKTGVDVNLMGSAGGGATVSGTLSAAAASSTTGTTSTTGTIVAAIGAAGAGTIVLAGGTYTALTLAFEASLDGTSWFPIDGASTDGSTVDRTPSFTAAGVRAWDYKAPGYQYIRVRAAAITQTVAPTVAITQGPFLYDPSPAVFLLDGQKWSYAAQLNGTSVASAVTTSADLFVIQNPSASGRIMRITRLAFELTLATAGTVPLLQLVKRSALDTAGTAVAQTVVPADANDPASTAVVNLYTAAPTVGAAVGVVRSCRLFGIATTLTAQPNGKEWRFGNQPGERALVLRPGQALGLMGIAAFGTAPTVTGDVEWTEEPS